MERLPNVVLVLLSSAVLAAQTPYSSAIKPSDVANERPINKGSAAVWQSLKKLQTRASLIMITAHPDDEDGGMLTYESRGQGARVVLLTLNRGEGGANVMSSDYFDALGLVRTRELLNAGRYYGVDQYWTRVVDYGFSKTMEEALSHWTRDRVLADVVRVVRMTRPLVITSVFIGGPSDGHGNHQVAGLMAREVFQAAGDPKMFPDQIREGLRTWTPLKYYALVPLFRRNQDAKLSVNVEVPEGDYDPVLGASYIEIAREGLGCQKTQNGGPIIPAAGPLSSGYHRFASVVPVSDKEGSFFDGIDTSLAGIASLAKGEHPEWLIDNLRRLNSVIEHATKNFDARYPQRIAPDLASGLNQTVALMKRVESSELSEAAKYDILHEIQIKKAQFNNALTEALGLSISATVTTGEAQNQMMELFGGEPDTFRVAVPGQRFLVNVHLANQGPEPVVVASCGVASQTGQRWPIEMKGYCAGTLTTEHPRNIRFQATVPRDAQYTRPYFSRPNIEQSYYDILDERYLSLPLSPYPLAAWADFTYRGAVAKQGEVVQTVQSENGFGQVHEPLLVEPAISVAISPHAGVVPFGTKTFPLTATVHSNVKGPAQGTLKLDVPAGWSASPISAVFKTPGDGADQSISFQVRPAGLKAKAYECTAVATFAGQEYREGYQMTGYPGLRPYPLFSPATYKTSGVDLKMAPDLKVGYISGTGDDVAAALKHLGVKITNLSSDDIEGGDLGRFDVIVLGVRAYAARPELATYNTRLLNFVRNGGVMIVQYNTPEFDHNYGPYHYKMGENPEEVTDEDSKIDILDPQNPIFNWPNKITEKDFEGWVEERGSKFMTSWDPRYEALLSTADNGQAPQKGGLLFARYGKGIYIYNAYAFYRQLPEGVPGAYRIFANMLSLAKWPEAASLN